MNVSGPTWDAAFYYSYARSLVFDQDFSIENDLQLSYATASPDFVSRQLHTNRTATDHVYAPFAIGSGLLWAPLLALLRLAASTVRLSAMTGFEWYIVGPLATFSALNGLLALIVAYRITAREAGRSSALISALSVGFATPLVYYQFREPLYAHVSSVLLNTIFIAVWWRWHDEMPSIARGAVLGALLAFCALMRWQNLIYVILPLISTVWTWLQAAPENRRTYMPLFIGYILAAAMAFLVVFSPQFFVWNSHYGSWLTIPQGSEFMNWGTPFLRETLLSSFRGLLPWMPLFALAVIGLVAQLRSRPRLVVPLLALLLLSFYINASSRDWFAGGGYGPRRFVGELLILVLGYAWLLALLSTWKRWLAGIIMGLALAAHQWLLLRYALAERIGGRVISMAPEFEWTEVPLSTFFAQLASHVPDLWTNPRDVFVFPAAPLSELVQAGRLPFEHLFSLLASGLFLAGCGVLFLLLRRSWRALQNYSGA